MITWAEIGIWDDNLISPHPQNGSKVQKVTFFVSSFIAAIDTSPITCQEIIDCAANPCENGGNCVNNVCQCPNGYEGSRCERMIDYCTQPGQNQCLNGGTCRSHPDMATTLCECPPEYSGQFCQDDVNECQDGGNSPCVNGGQCINHVSDYNTDIIQWKLDHPFNTHILNIRLTPRALVPKWYNFIAFFALIALFSSSLSYCVALRKWSPSLLKQNFLNSPKEEVIKHE